VAAQLERPQASGLRRHRASRCSNLPDDHHILVSDSLREGEPLEQIVEPG
jgi:hypothetical protein